MSDEEKTSIAFGPYYLEQSPEMFLGDEVDRVTAHKREGPLVTLYRVLPFDAAVRLCAKYFPDVSHESHSHFVRVLDVGCRNRIPFLAEEKVDGVTLESLLQEHVRLSASLVAAIGIGVCESLSALHREQDEDVARNWELHPRFIWLTNNGEVKLSMSAVLEKIRAARLAIRVGSGPDIPMPDLRYLSLERIRGEEQVRSSQFVVGSILCELLGRAPFGEDADIRTILAMVTKEPEFAPGVPDGLRAILLRAMQKSKEERFESYDVFADALREYLDEAPCGYEDIGALVRTLKRGANERHVERELERLSSMRWLRPDAEVEALTAEATDWLEGRLDEHLALTEPYALGAELPCRKLVLSRSCDEVLRLLEDASSETLPEEVFVYIKAQRAARQRAHDLCQTSAEASNIAERAAQRGLASLSVMPPKTSPETKHALQHIFAYGQHEAVIEAHVKHIALFGDLLASPWEPLLQLWERGVWPLDMLSTGFLVYVPLHRGEVLEPNVVREQSYLEDEMIFSCTLGVAADQCPSWHWRLV